MRRVEFTFYTGKGYEKIQKQGLFHAWGLDIAEEGSYSVGVVEDGDGKIYTPVPSQIKFIDRINTPENGSKDQRNDTDIAAAAVGV